MRILDLALLESIVSLLVLRWAIVGVPRSGARVVLESLESMLAHEASDQK